MKMIRKSQPFHAGMTLVLTFSSAMLLGIGLTTGPHNVLMACVFVIAGCIPWLIYGLIEGYYAGYNEAIERTYK